MVDIYTSRQTIIVRFADMRLLSQKERLKKMDPLDPWKERIRLFIFHILDLHESWKLTLNIWKPK